MTIFYDNFFTDGTIFLIDTQREHSTETHDNVELGMKESGIKTAYIIIMLIIPNLNALIQNQIFLFIKITAQRPTSPKFSKY
jgi:hypothetical protein